MEVIVFVIGISVGASLPIMFPKKFAYLTRFGVVDRVVNKDRKFGAATEYLHFRLMKDGKAYHKLMTEKQFESIQDRVSENKEDLLK